MSRRNRIGLAAAVAGMPFCAAVGMWDALGRRPAEAAVMAGAVVANGVSARVLARHRHQPDYDRIAELERELFP